MKKIMFSGMFLLFCSFLFGAKSSDFLWDQEERSRFEYIEEIREYQSFINWTTGKVHTEISVPESGRSPNVGRFVSENQSYVRDELRQNLIKAMGSVQISDLFQLKDYYSRMSDVRYEIISYADRAYYYPVMRRGSRFIGVVELELFGKNGIASIFNRDLERYRLTNYIKTGEESREYFDGLVIDTMNFPDFQPSLQMRIYDEDGVLLYGPETMEPEALQKRGVCEYTTSLIYAFNSTRSGSRVFYTLPYKLSGRSGTYLVINNKDAARLFASQRTVNYLNQGNVVVVKPPRKDR